MDLDDLLAFRDQLLVSRQQYHDAIVKLDDQLQATDDFIGVLESLRAQDPDLAVPPASVAPAPAAQRAGPRSADHPAVKALRSADLRPYRACTTIKGLAVAYARRHEGKVYMAELVPLAVRLGLSKSVLRKDAWGTVYKALRRDERFSASEGGMIVVDDALLRPRRA